MPAKYEGVYTNPDGGAYPDALAHNMVIAEVPDTATTPNDEFAGPPNESFGTANTATQSPVITELSGDTDIDPIEIRKQAIDILSDGIKAVDDANISDNGSTRHFLGFPIKIKGSESPKVTTLFDGSQQGGYVMATSWIDMNLPGMLEEEAFPVRLIITTKGFERTKDSRHTPAYSFPNHVHGAQTIYGHALSLERLLPDGTTENLGGIDHYNGGYDSNARQRSGITCIKDGYRYTEGHQYTPDITFGPHILQVDLRGQKAQDILTNLRYVVESFSAQANDGTNNPN